MDPMTMMKMMMAMQGAGKMGGGAATAPAAGVAPPSPTSQAATTPGGSDAMTALMSSLQAPPTNIPDTPYTTTPPQAQSMNPAITQMVMQQLMGTANAGAGQTPLGQLLAGR